MLRLRKKGAQKNFLPREISNIDDRRFPEQVAVVNIH